MVQSHSTYTVLIMQKADETGSAYSDPHAHCRIYYKNYKLFAFGQWMGTSKRANMRMEESEE